MYEVECDICEKIFGFKVNYYLIYYEVKLLCKNGEFYRWGEIIGVFVEYFIDRY